jgi:hypothetical protein
VQSTGQVPVVASKVAGGEKREFMVAAVEAGSRYGLDIKGGMGELGIWTYIGEIVAVIEEGLEGG